MSELISDALEARRVRVLQRLRQAQVPLPIEHEAAVMRLAVASDFAIDVLQAQPTLLTQLLADAQQPITAPELTPENRAEWATLLRRYRQAASMRLVWRDVLDGADVEEILTGSTALAETCIQLALTALQTEFEQRFGVVRTAEGQVQTLVVFALGKLGGRELNFSSDVDLVYAYEQDGESDGGRILHAQDYFARLGQQLAKLLDEVTADGFCHRVDLRLRPFGSAGRVAMSFAAMELYFQREGRDWERYAWQKARPVAGDFAAGERFLAMLRPFVYRRYLDYGALDGLRAMKAMIAAEVTRKELADDIKRGPGGIREIEFLAQALQMIRGGREPALRRRHLLTALQAIMRAGYISTEVGEALIKAYRFLRRLENRLQMMGDAQTYALPSDAIQQQRIALGLGYAHWAQLVTDLQTQRQWVSQEFAALLAPQQHECVPADALQGYWRALPDHADANVLLASGFVQAEGLHTQLRDFSRSPGVRDLSDTARARLDRILPALLQHASATVQPDTVLRRVLPLLGTILRRASYLALLDEQPAALVRLADTLGKSALLGERLVAYPLLLDELLDVRISGGLPSMDSMRLQCREAVRQSDIEQALGALNEVRQALSFRFALAFLDGRIDAKECAQHLAWLADAVIDGVLTLATEEVRSAHGEIAGGCFAVLGYGTLGGEELGFGSDLDLVFLFDAPEDALSNGARPLDATRWYARLGQKIVSLLAVRTAAGRLFDVDVRLRPDGAKGLLVSSLASFTEYQQKRAWTWEHQALVRARGIAGDACLLAAFETLRRQVLSAPREAARLREDVAGMRQKMRTELDRSDAAMLDIKQGQGGLVDLEFLLQFIVLRDAQQQPALLASRSSASLLQAARAVRSLPEAQCQALHEAHAVLLDAGLRCTLDRRPRRVMRDAAIEQACRVIQQAAHSLALFEGE